MDHCIVFRAFLGNGTHSSRVGEGAFFGADAFLDKSGRDYAIIAIFLQRGCMPIAMAQFSSFSRPEAAGSCRQPKNFFCASFAAYSGILASLLAKA
jgi:hypothetical protein